MKKLLLSTLIGTVTLCHAFGIETGVGVAGYGIGVTLPIQQSDFSIKLNANKLQFDLSNTNADINSFGLLLDYKLWRGLSVNGGLYYLNGNANENQPLVVNNAQQVQISNTVTMNIDTFSPYLGLSYKADIYKGWYLNTDLGVMQVKSQKTQHIVTDMINDGQLAQSNYNNVTNMSSVIPVAKISIGFDF